MLRRNGKPRSCEPCRISKIRCDHTTPICSKCQARGITDQCFYHPAPMTKPAGTPRKQPERRRVAKQRHSDARESRSHERLSPIHLSPVSLRSDLGAAAASCPASNHTWPTPPDSATRPTQSSSETVRSFYLGSTSYASVFAEERPLPDAMHAQPAQRMSVSASDQRKVTGSRHCNMEIGRTIVSALNPFSLFEKSLAMYFELNKATALVAPIIMSAVPQLRKDIDQLLTLGNDSYIAFGDITRNTAKPMKVPPTMMLSEFHTLFTGENLRWETLGLIFIIAGSNAQFTSPDHPIFTLESGAKIDKEEFIENMIHASNDCISLCQVHGAVNDIMVWLLYHNMLVTSNFYGENYHGVWRRQGEALSALYAEGIHCETTFEEPFFLCEARRRLYHAVYRSDKTLAVFLGRPPMMAMRYSDRKQPLDIDDDVLAADNPEVLNAALSKLDSEGWNTEGHMFPATWIRLRSQFSLFKERFLDHSLAGIKSEDIVSKVQAISEDARQFWERLPSHLRYDLYEEDTAWNTFTPNHTLRMISAYLEYLHMEFQMQRLIRRQTQMALPALLEISMKLLSTVMVFNKLRNQVYDIQRHVPTIILYYCLPSAGVLALELRRCTLENVPLPSSVPRADVIRNLSVLISCLDWVILPGDGNYRLCIELNKMLALVLDEVLNYQPPPKEAQGDGNDTTTALGGLGAGFFDIPMIDGMEPIPTESEDFLNWLDNANWNNTSLF